MIENILHDPGKWRKPVQLTPQQKKVIRYLIECTTQEEAARKCFMSLPYYKEVLQRLRNEFGCATNIQLVVKINLQTYVDRMAA